MSSAPTPVAAAPRPAPPAPVVAVDEAKIAELRQLAEKQEGAKRYNEYVKTLLQLAALVPDADEKVALYYQGGGPLRHASSRTRPRP